MVSRNTRKVEQRDDSLDSLIEPIVARPLVEPAYISTPDEPLIEVSDRRAFSPAFNPAVEIGGRPAAVVHLKTTPLNDVHRVRALMENPVRIFAPIKKIEHRLGFDAPQRVIICARRAIRREVLFALNKKGKRGGKRRRSHYSNVRC